MVITEVAVSTARKVHELGENFVLVSGHVTAAPAADSPLEAHETREVTLRLGWEEWKGPAHGAARMEMLRPRLIDASGFLAASAVTEKPKRLRAKAEDAPPPPAPEHPPADDSESGEQPPAE